MTVQVSLNAWSVGVVLTVLIWAVLWKRVQSQGQWDFGAAVFGALGVGATLALWIGILVARFL